MSLHSRIKEARVQKGLTQAQLGEKIGMAKTTVTGWEKDREPTAAQIGALADILEVDVNFLLQDEIKKQKELRATPHEMEHLVKKYRSLDPYGKEAVDGILDVEYRRCTESVSLSNLHMIKAAARSGDVSEIKEIYLDELPDEEVIP